MEPDQRSSGDPLQHHGGPTHLHRSLQRGTLTFQLIVNDGQNNSSPATVTITVTSSSSTDLALSATATAPSQNTSTGQTANKAIDGVIDGYPGDYTKEWATAGGGAGSWLKLTWTSPQTVNMIVLYDRPNTSDQITAGNIHSVMAAVSRLAHSISMGRRRPTVLPAGASPACSSTLPGSALTLKTSGSLRSRCTPHSRSYWAGKCFPAQHCVVSNQVQSHIRHTREKQDYEQRWAEELANPRDEVTSCWKHAMACSRG